MKLRLHLVLALAAALLPAAASAEARRPNILLIVGDDMGYADVSVHGSREIPTPHIDSIARNGVRCTSGYVTGPYCSPTRAALLTGRYQQRFGHEFNPGPPAQANVEVGLPLTESTMAQRMKAAGYATALVGKWHLGHAEKFYPTNRGFGEFFGFLAGAHSYNAGDPPGQRGEQPRTAIMRGTKPTQTTEYLTDALGREAVAYVERHKAEPFFLYLAFNAVHTPMQAPQHYRDRFRHIADEKRRTYAAMMSAMDDAIGAVLAKLRKENLEENTLVFFISDNGGPPVNASSNAPLRGHKASTWEGGVRVPFLVQWKGRLPAGKVYDQPVAQIDILPTALAAAGATVQPEWKLDGVDLLPHLSGKADRPPHDALYWRFGPQRAIRAGDWKLVQGRARAAGGVRRPQVTEWQLFNLAKDVGEQTDLSAQEPDRVKQMQASWEKWNAELVAPAWNEPPRGRNPNRDPDQPRRQRRQKQK